MYKNVCIIMVKYRTEDTTKLKGFMLFTLFALCIFLFILLSCPFFDIPFGLAPSVTHVRFFPFIYCQLIITKPSNYPLKQSKKF